MRIIAGRWAGRDLTSPGGPVRPTAEAVRGALFDWLGPVVEGARVLDLFAGTGALGLEAMSRGAAAVDFVEFSPAALHALKANVARLRSGPKGWGRAGRRGSTKRSPGPAPLRVFKQDALRFIADPRLEHYDVVLADPPYTSTLATRLAERWLAQPFSGILVIEHAAPPRAMPGGERPSPGRRPGPGTRSSPDRRRAPDRHSAPGEGSGPLPEPPPPSAIRMRTRTLSDSTAATRYDAG